MTFFLEICDAIFPLQKITMKTKKVERYYLDYNRDQKIIKEEAASISKVFFKKNYKQYKNLFGKTKKKG